MSRDNCLLFGCAGVALALASFACGVFVERARTKPILDEIDEELDELEAHVFGNRESACKCCESDSNNSCDLTVAPIGAIDALTEFFQESGLHPRHAYVIVRGTGE